MVQQVALLGSDAGICERLVYLHGLGLDIFAVFPVESLLCDLAYVDLGIEVCGKSLMVVAGVAIHDVQILDFVKVVLGSICCEDAGHSGVESAAQYGSQSSLLKALAVSPLPAVLKVCFVLGLIVGRIHIVASCLQASLHDGEVLIRQGQIEHQFRLVVREQSHQLLHAVGIHLCCAHLCAIFLVQHLGQCYALLLSAAGNHHLGKHLGILAYLVGGYSSHTSGSDNQYSSHIYVCLFVFSLLVCCPRPFISADPAGSVPWRVPC